MALKEDNYWGKRSSATAAQIRRPATSADNQSGLTDAELDALVKSLSNPQQAQQIGQNVANQYVNGLKRDVHVNNGGASGMAVAQVPDIGVKFKAPAAAPAVQDIGGPSLGDALGGIGELAGKGAGIFGDIAQAALGGNANGGSDMDPEAIYNRLRQQVGQYTYNGPSAAEMAAKEFDPQFALLDSLKKQTEDRYSRNKQDITGMYNALVNSQTQGRSQDQAMFQQAAGTVGQNYKQATDNLTGSATAYQQAMAKQLASLGIQEGTGDVVARAGQNLQDNVARLNTQGAAAKNLMTQLGANEYAFDTNNIGVAKQAGLNTQEQFLQDFMDRMAGNDQQRMQLTGQRGQAENNYGMQIQDLLQKGRASLESNIADQYKAIMGGYQQQQDNYFKQAGLDLDLSKFNWQKDPTNPANAPSAPKLNPYDALSSRAATVYKDPQKARQVVDQIMAAYQQDPGAATVGDFLNHLDNQDALKQDPNLTPLIYDFINQMLSQRKP